MACGGSCVTSVPTCPDCGCGEIWVYKVYSVRSCLQLESDRYVAMHTVSFPGMEHDGKGSGSILYMYGHFRKGKRVVTNESLALHCTGETMHK